MIQTWWRFSDDPDQMMIQAWWWSSDALDQVMIQTWWWSSDDPYQVVIQWCSRSSDDVDLMMIYWCSRSGDDLDLMMIQWFSRSSDDPDLKMNMTWKWRWLDDDPNDTQKKTCVDKLFRENTFLVKRECWYICKFRMYSLVYLMYCTPMFIPGSVCNLFESCHALMSLSRDSIM